MAHIAADSLNRRAGGALRKVVSRIWHQAGLTLDERCLAARFEERVRERERTARELHETLLQGTQAP